MAVYFGLGIAWLWFGLLVLFVAVIRLGGVVIAAGAFGVVGDVGALVHTGALGHVIKPFVAASRQQGKG